MKNFIVSVILSIGFSSVVNAESPWNSVEAKCKTKMQHPDYMVKGTMDLEWGGHRQWDLLKIVKEYNSNKSDSCLKLSLPLVLNDAVDWDLYYGNQTACEVKLKSPADYEKLTPNQKKCEDVDLKSWSQNHKFILRVANLIQHKGVEIAAVEERLKNFYKNELNIDPALAEISTTSDETALEADGATEPCDDCGNSKSEDNIEALKKAAVSVSENLNDQSENEENPFEKVDPPAEKPEAERNLSSSELGGGKIKVAPAMPPVNLSDSLDAALTEEEKEQNKFCSQFPIPEDLRKDPLSTDDESSVFLGCVKHYLGDDLFYPKTSEVEDDPENKPQDNSLVENFRSIRTLAGKDLTKEELNNIKQSFDSGVPSQVKNCLNNKGKAILNCYESTMGKLKVAETVTEIGVAAGTAVALCKYKKLEKPCVATKASASFVFKKLTPFWEKIKPLVRKFIKEKPYDREKIKKYDRTLEQARKAGVEKTQKTMRELREENLKKKR